MHRAQYNKQVLQELEISVLKQQVAFLRGKLTTKHFRISSSDDDDDEQIERTSRKKKVQNHYHDDKDKFAKALVKKESRSTLKLKLLFMNVMKKIPLKMKLIFQKPKNPLKMKSNHLMTLTRTKLLELKPRVVRVLLLSMKLMRKNYLMTLLGKKNHLTTLMRKNIWRH